MIGLIIWIVIMICFMWLSFCVCKEDGVQIDGLKACEIVLFWAMWPVTIIVSIVSILAVPTEYRNMQMRRILTLTLD